MTGEADLSGYRVLIVEDEYYLAEDAAQVLRGAGAEVMGPCPTEQSARAALEQQHLDAVLLDVNLGSGPTFKLAETLKDRGIPFVFFTGYDQVMIPKEFDHVERIVKPVEPRKIVAAISKVVVAP
jgi:DNA-binding response OmpR family regulator